MDSKSQRVKLNDGHFIPVLGFGTYAPPEVAKREALEFTPFAIEVGFRHIDCAHAYQNEEEIGQAIRSKIADGTVKREDIFCTSKALEKCKDAGLTKSIGVSNFNHKQLEEILNKPGLKYKPVCNQVFDFELTPEDMKAIDGLNRNIRYYEFHQDALEFTPFAIEVGFRHIDCAHAYQNEEQIGQAIWSKIADGTVKREDIFCTSKLWCTSFRPELVQPALEKSLKSLQLDYVDLYIMHYPLALKALEKCKDAGLAKSIGVSNFNHKQLEKILNKPGLRYKPVCNQVECHPYLNQRKLLDFCKSHDIVLVAYSALGSQRVKGWVNLNHPVLLEDPVLSAIAQKHKKTPALVALRYQIQRGVVVLAKGNNKEWIKENMQVFDFELTPEDMKAIDGLDRNIRYCDFQLGVGHPEFPFSEEY
ncbi:hypothetical protein G4228_015616 [Cervus hanglu yarkandensis]|nr:hypothetical protein G4228_015616 [Cervus hanglu yarkandensis]